MRAGRKTFFFEKKKQNTSISRSACRSEAWQGSKSFLVLFFKKEQIFFLVFFVSSAQATPSLLSTYTQHCSGCHGTAGAGVPEKGIPDLAESGLYAGTSDGRAYLVQVPGISQSRLDDDTAARMLNYVLTRFSAARLPAGFHPFTAAEIGALRANKASDASRRRQELLAGLGERALAQKGK